jgi:hypothetical protein
MPRGNSFLISATAILMSGPGLWGQLDRGLGSLDVPSTPALSEYCHIVRFPQGWKNQPVDRNGQRLWFDYGAEYEFRVEGVLGRVFLVGGFETRVGQRYDAANRYRIDLSNPRAPVLPANANAWEAATVVPLTRRSVFAGGTIMNDRHAEYNAFMFMKRGEIWIQPASDSTRLSPDQAWLVLQSMTPPVSEGQQTKVFFDIFNADTGRKVLAFEGIYSAIVPDVDGYLARTAWLTERYFIVPLGEHKERCLVCDFAARRPRSGGKK